MLRRGDSIQNDWWGPERQRIERASWQIATELMRRYPQRLQLFELHPGGGIYDCLSLVDRAAPLDGAAIDLNRNGRAHVLGRFDGVPVRGVEDEALAIWDDPATYADPVAVAECLGRAAGLPPIRRRPPTTPEVLVYRVITALLEEPPAPNIQWECRQGLLDTSGYDGGVRETWFNGLPAARDRMRERGTSDAAACDFWFLLRDGEPAAAFDIGGLAWNRSGTAFELMERFRTGGRRLKTVVADLKAGAFL